MQSPPSPLRARERFFVHDAFRLLLRDQGLLGVDEVMDWQAGTVVRSVPGRTTRRVELRSRDGSAVVAYLKCYEPGYFSRQRRWLCLLGWPDTGQEALKEWRQLLALRERGFQTAAPVAAGHRSTGRIGAARAFVMTAEIPHAVSGYDYLAAGDDRRRRALVPRLAALARRFHAARFIHKDFYLGHILVAGGDESPGLYLIDLQRVLGPGTFLPRWRVKDIGSMIFSLQKAGARHVEVLRFFRLYRGPGRIGGVDRRFLARALRRAAWLHTRVPKYGEPRAAEV